MARHTGKLAILIVAMFACQQVFGSFQEPTNRTEIDSKDHTPSAACATPASSRTKKNENSVPYRRPSFHPPRLNQNSDAKSSPEFEFQADEFESEIDQTIIKDSQPSNLPKLNALRSRETVTTGPEMNSPGIAKEPASAVTLPTVPRAQQSAPAPTPLGPIKSLPPASPLLPLPMNVGQYDDLSGIEFNFSDSSCKPIACSPNQAVSGAVNLGRGRLGSNAFRGPRQLVKHNQQSAHELWEYSQRAISGENSVAPGIGLGGYALGAGISEGSKENIQSAQVAPGLMQGDSFLDGSTGQMQKVSNRGDQGPALLPDAPLARDVATTARQQRNTGIIIHPPMIQPFNRNQHTFVIENQGDADAEDVVIEINVQQHGRIIAALPDNSVTTDKVSIFKFPKIVAGESVPVHVTAVSSSGLPIEFSASLVSRAVYSFHTQSGTQQGKLSNVSYLNDQTLGPRQTRTKDGPVRVTNPFFGNQRRGPNQASAPTRLPQR